MMHSENERIQYTWVLTLPLNPFGSDVRELDSHAIKYHSPLHSSPRCVRLAQAALTPYKFLHLPALFPHDPYRMSIENGAYSDENLG